MQGLRWPRPILIAVCLALREQRFVRLIALATLVSFSYVSASSFQVKKKPSLIATFNQLSIKVATVPFAFLNCLIVHTHTRKSFSCQVVYVPS